jgi:hypothetical protein
MFSALSFTIDLSAINEHQVSVLVYIGLVGTIN